MKSHLKSFLMLLLTIAPGAWQGSASASTTIDVSTKGFAAANFVVVNADETLSDVGVVSYVTFNGDRRLFIRVCPVADEYPHTPSLACADYQQVLTTNEFAVDSQATLASIDTTVAGLGAVHIEITSVSWALAEVHCASTQLRDEWTVVQPLGVRWAEAWGATRLGDSFLWSSGCGSLGKEPFAKFAFL